MAPRPEQLPTEPTDPPVITPEPPERFPNRPDHELPGDDRPGRGPRPDHELPETPEPKRDAD